MTQQILALHGNAKEVSARATSRPGRMVGSRSRRRILQTGDHLFQAGELYQEAFIIRTGHLKSYRIHRDGEEQILGVYGPGDALGFDALFGKVASCSVVALEVASIEIIDLYHPDMPANPHPNGDATLIAGMYQELQRMCRLLQLDRHPAERRLAEFLLDCSRSESERGGSRSNLRLSFNRRDLARYLGLAPETLSRTFSRFQEQHILSVNNREIQIIDRQALVAAAGE
ncbi:helix-turn-helix domain-containing protein [Wenzhouxiangella sp. EGI_FJ10305]|uniref:helix-turn-helix domain-containing protein n=1 Tax=Wenzhouxiangella sp. EGI_FJ10305 TaxID=3243768 RepID=UPI0035DB6055